MSSMRFGSALLGWLDGEREQQRRVEVGMVCLVSRSSGDVE